MNDVLVNPNDIVMTPDWLAEDVMRYFPWQGRLMEPCRGDGAFYNLMPAGSVWGEIREGRDFLTYKGRVDWIITNPPYSTFDAFLTQALTVADNVVVVIPVNKLLSSYKKMRQVMDWGGIREIRYYGSGRQVGFPFGFPVGAIWLQRNYKGDVRISCFTS